MGESFSQAVTRKPLEVLGWCILAAGVTWAQPSTRLNPCGVSASDRLVSASTVQPGLVQVPVLVMEGNDNVVLGLDKDRFVLYQDQVRQSISRFEVENSPVSVGFVVDTSRSMARKLPATVDVVAGFLSVANHADEFFVVTFDSAPHLLVPMTNKPELVRKPLSELSANGETALLDALKLSLSEMKVAHHHHKVLIVISDGKDNASQCTLHDMFRELSAMDVQVFAINSSSTYGVWPPRSSTGGALLTKITRPTGGRLFEARKPEDMSGFASIIASCLRNQYLLGYIPRGLDGRQQFHRIEVHVVSPDGSTRYRTFWRAGYYSPEK